MSDQIPSHRMDAQTSLPQDHSIINYENEAEIDDSKYQIAWTEVMGKGNYKNPSTYKKVEVLLLYWEKHSDDLEIEPEVTRLKSVFEKKFKYNCRIEYLDNCDEKPLQLQLNSKVAGFAYNHDAPNTLFIVYYAGHGRPGRAEGLLELHGFVDGCIVYVARSLVKVDRQTSPNDKEKRLDRLVWNMTEELLQPAAADVLEIFDCCYAGTLGWTRGDQRSLEYLAATTPNGVTAVPGPTSFTSALIWALENLVEEKPGGCFTTVDLLKKIKEDAPYFPEKQTPVLSNRLHKYGSVGHIMLRPLEREGLSASTPHRGANKQDAARQTVTLCFDFDEKPSVLQIQTFGHALNKLFEQNTLGVNGIRWGGMQPTATGTAIRFINRLRRASLLRHMKEQLTIETDRLAQWLPGNSLGPPTPSSLGQLSPGAMSPAILVSDDTGKCSVASTAEDEVSDDIKLR